MPPLNNGPGDLLFRFGTLFPFARCKMAAFGILQEKKFEHTPGTVILHDDTAAGVAAQAAAALKHGTGRYAHIVLVPQPSDDPNDPLVGSHMHPREGRR